MTGVDTGGREPSPLDGRRYASCVEAFGIDGEYNPSCCRWPKSCSPFPYREAIAAGNVTDAMLEPAPPAEATDADQLAQAAEIMADQYAPRQLFGSAIEGSTLDDGRRAEEEVWARKLIARHLRVLVSAVNVTDWPAYIRSVADGHDRGTSWLDERMIAERGRGR